MENIVELEPGCSGKAELLIEVISGVICQEQFAEMTLAEVLGALELVKLRLAQC